jgi:hypothetical protein
MPKYIIEGEIDFFSELYKSLDNEESIFKNQEDETLCLITNQPLIDKFVTMACGHKFNYIPLFKDLYSHKKNFNHMESSSGRLNKNEIRCPYCRKKQTELLPYYNDIGITKVPGINEIYVSLSPSSNDYTRCQYILPHIEEEHLDASGVPQLLKCSLIGTPIDFCTNNTNYGDTKSYCWVHKKIMIKKYKNQIIQKTKEDKIKIKLQKKEETKKIKEETKLKEKEEKLKTKMLKKQIVTTDIEENIILAPFSLQQNNDGCVSILKSGTNKGKYCGCTIYNHDDKLCKRHYVIKSK